MSKMNRWMMAAILICGTAWMTSCNMNTGVDKITVKAEDDSVAVVKDMDNYLAAVERYLVDTIGSQYSPGELCIPCAIIVGVDEQNHDSVLVWGDFWVFNYNVVGDTLKTVSGGSHPGMMSVIKTDLGYHVAAFDQVVDGSGNLESAKRIFGDKYDAFHAINSDQDKREEARAQFISSYVKENGLDVTMYQDYGWPAVPLP